MKFERQQNKENEKPNVSIENVDQSKILELESNANLVVREVLLEELENEYRGKLNGDYSAVELAELGKELFDELRSEYGIDSPVKFLFSKNRNNEPSLFSIVDKIESVTLGQEEKDEVSQKFYQLHESISQYYLDKLRNGGAFLTDINGPTQYVYGTKLTKQDGDVNIYLVDTDIYLDNKKESLLTLVYWLARHGSGVEKDSKMIENIRIFMSEYQEKFTQIEDKDKERLIQLKNFLSGQAFGKEILPAIPLFE